MGDALIPMLTPAEAAERAAEVGVSGQLAALNVFRVLLNCPRAAKATADLLLELLCGRALDHRLRELVIMRVGWMTGSEYEWTQHWRIATEVFGLDRDDVLAVREWERSEHFGESERAVLSATDETLKKGQIHPDTLERCRRALGEPGVIELVLAIGMWRTVSELTRGLDIPVEDGVASWPPDGRVPV
jgi:alkylhydroperoxidase family enzyme